MGARKKTLIDSVLKTLTDAIHTVFEYGKRYMALLTLLNVSGAVTGMLQVSHSSDRLSTVTTASYIHLCISFVHTFMRSCNILSISVYIAGTSSP